MIVVLFHFDTGMFYVGVDASYLRVAPFKKYDSLDDFFGPLTSKRCAELVIDLCSARGIAEYSSEYLKPFLRRILDTRKLPDGLVERIGCCK